MLIVDTEWKRLAGFDDDPRGGAGRADVRQTMAYARVYARVYGCARVMLLYPHHRGQGRRTGRSRSRPIARFCERGRSSGPAGTIRS